MKSLPTKERLEELFEYKDGHLIYKRTIGRAVKGMTVGWVEGNGYRCTNVDGTRYRMHRIIYQMHHGWCPEFIDHIDHDKQNNKIENLRPATQQQNARNKPLGRKNTSGFKGVCWDKCNNKFKADIRINGKSKHLGYFDDPKEAAESYKEASKRYHGDFACA
jgi:hypothetical protein